MYVLYCTVHTSPCNACTGAHPRGPLPRARSPVSSRRCHTCLCHMYPPLGACLCSRRIRSTRRIRRWDGGVCPLARTNPSATPTHGGHLNMVATKIHQTCGPRRDGRALTMEEKTERAGKTASPTPWESPHYPTTSPRPQRGPPGGVHHAGYTHPPLMHTLAAVARRGVPHTPKPPPSNSLRVGDDPRLLRPTAPTHANGGHRGLAPFTTRPPIPTRQNRTDAHAPA